MAVYVSAHASHIGAAVAGLSRRALLRDPDFRFATRSKFATVMSVVPGGGKSLTVCHPRGLIERLAAYPGSNDSLSSS